MRLSRIHELRTELDAERISYGELAEIGSAFDELDPATLSGEPEDATAVDMLNELEAQSNGKSNIPAGSMHPAVTADARAVVRARRWLDEEGMGGAYSGSSDDIKAAMNRFHPLGWVGFKANNVR